jgi:hypothetical protein
MRRTLPDKAAVGAGSTFKWNNIIANFEVVHRCVIENFSRLSCNVVFGWVVSDVSKERVVFIVKSQVGSEEFFIRFGPLNP